MNNIKNSLLLEEAYQKFNGKDIGDKCDANVDFIGINFSQDPEIPPVFKTYYAMGQSMGNISPIILPLFDRDMVYKLNKIDDTENHGCIRYDIRLKNRTNFNMDFLMNWIERLFPDLRKYYKEIESFFNLKCTESEDYKYAALYFLGLIIELDRGESPNFKAVQFHYLLRNCKDADHIGHDYTIDSSNYLTILTQTGIPEMVKLSAFVTRMLTISNEELWIAAVDYFRTGRRKYKIYLKKESKSIYQALIDCLIKENCVNLAAQIRIYLEWREFHPELKCYGLAICLDSNGVWSVNLYH